MTVIVVGLKIVIVMHHEKGRDMVPKIGTTMAQRIEIDIAVIKGVARKEIWIVVIVVAAKAGKGGANVP